LMEHKNETVMSNHSPDLEESGRHNHSRLPQVAALSAWVGD
jgi:hypothetical protein